MAVLRKIAFQLHLILGLVFGGVISLMGLSGAALVYEVDLERILHPELTVVEASAEHASLQTLVDNVLLKRPDDSVRTIVLPGDPTASAILRCASGVYVFADPHTGDILGERIQKLSLFGFILEVHRFLGMGQTGKIITGVSTLGFVAILFSGLWLFMPRRWSLKSIYRRTVKLFTTRVSMVNLHTQVGLLLGIVLLINALTGLIWAFDWYEKGLYVVTGSSMPEPPPKSQVLEDGARYDEAALYDGMLAETLALYPEFREIRVTPTRTEEASVRVRVVPQDGPHVNARTYLFFDRYSGELLRHDAYAKHSLGQKLRYLAYPLHRGYAGGRIHQGILFIAGLSVSLLFLTGLTLFVRRKFRRP